MNKFKSLLMVGLLSAGFLNADDGKIDMLQSIKDHTWIMPAAFVSSLLCSYNGNMDTKVKAHAGTISAWALFYFNWCKNKSDVATLISLYGSGTVIGGILHKLK